MHTEQPKGGAYAWISAVEDSYVVPWTGRGGIFRSVMV